MFHPSVFYGVFTSKPYPNPTLQSHSRTHKFVLSIHTMYPTTLDGTHTHTLYEHMFPVPFRSGTFRCSVLLRQPLVGYEPTLQVVDAMVHD